MGHYRPLSFALIVGVLLALPASAQPVGIRWQQDIESAKKLARESNRLVLIHFWTESCGPCKMLEQNVFNQPGVGTAIEAQFVPVTVAPVHLTNIVFLTGGAGHSLALRENGTVAAWGDNSREKLRVPAGSSLSGNG